MKKIKRIGHDVVYMDDNGNQVLKYEPVKVERKKGLIKRLLGKE